MNFERVVGEVHSVRDDGIHDGVQMMIEHTSVDVQQAQARFEKIVGGTWSHRWKIRILHGGAGQRPSFRTAFKGLNKPRCYPLKSGC